MSSLKSLSQTRKREETMSNNDNDGSYTVTWTYTTFRQGMSPLEAAELALGVIMSGDDPAAEAGHVYMTVRDDETGEATDEVVCAHLPSKSEREAL